MKNFYVFVLTCTVNILTAQTVTTNPSLTLDELLESITTDLECTSISNITSPNNSILGGESFNSYAGFQLLNEPNFPFETGIVLTTSDATDLSMVATNGSFNWPGDVDLEALIQQPGATYNATVLEFDFVPFRDHLSVDYVFASEEYQPAFVCNFADTFAFIVSGPGISNVNSYDHDANPSTSEINLDLGGLNIATLPGTSVPVNVTNVHDFIGCAPGTLGEFALSQFYDSQSSDNNVLDFRGQTVTLTAEVDLIPGQTYHIKLVIADRGDTLFNSAVFIDANSFVIGTIPEDLPYQPGLPVTLPYCWSSDDFASFEVSNDCSVGSENHLKLYGGDYSVTTAAVDTDGLTGVDVSFDLLNGCEDAAEAGENLIIEYFDGSVWQLLDEIDPANLPSSFSSSTNTWQTFNYTITTGLSMNFKLKFKRFNGDNLQDDMSISNLSITNSTLSATDFNLDDVLIYPNPAQDIINFEGLKDSNAIEIFDMNGKLISTYTLNDLNQNTLDIRSFESGIYLVKIFNSRSSVVRKIVKK